MTRVQSPAVSTVGAIVESVVQASAHRGEVLPCQAVQDGELLVALFVEAQNTIAELLDVPRVTVDVVVNK